MSDDEIYDGFEDEEEDDEGTDEEDSSVSSEHIPEAGSQATLGVDESLISFTKDMMPPGPLRAIAGSIVTLQVLYGDANPMVAEAADEIISGLRVFLAGIKADLVGFVGSLIDDLPASQRPVVVDQLLDDLIERRWLAGDTTDLAHTTVVYRDHPNTMAQLNKLKVNNAFLIAEVNRLSDQLAAIERR